jgi:hypothetical protein
MTQVSTQRLIKWAEAAIGAAAVLILLTAAWAWTNRVSLVRQYTRAATVADDEASDDSTKQAHAERLARINERNIFMPPKPKGFRGQVAGVLGDSALINGQLYKVGQSVAGATIKAIGPDWVEIEFEGKTSVKRVFASPPGVQPPATDAIRRME